ncbi:hydantoinase/oxoprolinase family protein [Rhodovulum sp. BSW8]|uniref:Hydantoinase/oxoprolinase family protein n=1 Tax=Rhodovulum visakhapatnamense TaxID=364297 RepID=A0ABS1RI71_9RHOB|nr:MULTISPECIES: hydantoinase/oxoprolinase family protein [Rhodovulum]MBL3569129.1 hydantoinase/oxoprolinase family protein [Rhodovulum visakhapatnamense]MBL3579323.1 hydantoinase/oxoprolinase family protein [Rhodovulum visakhapatnamense]OLS44749.1 acetone carboxylase subunit beta [Rhodovulum sulfidophilum]RBO54437.1 hydantoinase/oxoprolinase family protein [Rhodovulum sp. BSW8]
MTQTARNARSVQVLGIDAGGTMTDTFFVDADGDFVVGKAQTTPANEAQGLLESSREGLEHWGLTLEDALRNIQTGVYSGTAMLNRVVQRKGLRVGLIVNAGMEDFHRMGRAIQAYLGFAYEDRIHINTHYYDDPLVPRDLTRGVAERIDMMGTVVIPLNEDTARTAARELIAEDVEGIVISLLHSYKNPTHERRVRDIVEDEVKASGKPIPVFASTDYYPVRKETHRTNTTVLEAYAAEPSRQTLHGISGAFKDHGSKFDFRVMATHGGTISWKAKELARTIVSGPIGGVIGAKYLGEKLGYKNIACSDIGGTSFDVALITQGELTIRNDPDMARLVLSLPLVAMDSVGAGAGSFVRLDPYTKAIKLGPDSAGYRVGVCWAESGIDTVSISDCHVVLGYLNPDNFLGGQVKLDRQRAWDAIKVQVADPLGMSVEDAAAGVIELLDAELRDYMRSMISGKGYSPGSFTCFSYGGAGPVHTYGYTEGLGFEDVIVPAWAAGFSAFGCAAADFEYRYDKSLDINIDTDAHEADKASQAEVLQAAWDELTERVLEEFERNGYAADKVELQPGFRMQYRGQLNDLEIESPIASAGGADDWDRLVSAFNDTYGRVYAASARSPELGYSVTGAIMRGTVPIPKPKIPEEPLHDATPPREARTGTRQFYRKGRWVEAQLYRMETLLPGNQIVGPAIIESDATTFVVPDGFETWLDEHRLFHLKEL